MIKTVPYSDSGENDEWKDVEEEGELDTGEEGSACSEIMELDSLSR